MKSLYRVLWYSLALVFFSSCGPGSLEGTNPSEAAEQRGGQAVPAEDEGGMRVEGAPVISTGVEEVVSWRSASGFANEATLDTHTTVVTFNPLPESALRELQEENRQNSNTGLNAKALKIGVHRKADETEIREPKPFVLNWQDIGNGVVAKFVLTSPDAQRIRVALQLHALPDSAEFRFSGSGEPEKIVGVIRGKEAKALRSENKAYLTPSTEGETQNIELYLPPTAETKDAEIQLDGVSHIFTSARDAQFTERLWVGNSLSCHMDVVCRFDELGAAFQRASRAVARMEYRELGSLFSCSGTLLRDTGNSGTPYFWSAAHCINTQETADTLETFWFEEASRCGDNASVNLGSIHRVGGGAQLLHARTDTDTLLLRLNNFPPADAFFSGWDSRRFLSGAMMTIHHPRSDIKKVTIGAGEGICSLSFEDIDSSTLTHVRYTEGTSQPGSSGSGLFTLSNGEYLLRGGNVGGKNATIETCQNVASAPKCYSSLHLVWDDVRQWLAPTAAPLLSNRSLTNITATSADFSITSNENASAYWVVLPANEPAPSAAQIVARAGGNTGTMTTNTVFSRTLSGLSSRTAYRLHFVASGNGVLSAVWSEAFSTAPLPIVDVPIGVDGRILTPAQTGDTANWIEIARNGNYSLIVRSEFINIYPSRVLYGNVVWNEPNWQYTSFGTTPHYMLATNPVRRKINNWFNGSASGEAEKLSENARMRNFAVQTNVREAMGTSTWPVSVNDGFTRPSSALLGRGDDVAFALSYGESANFLSIFHFLRNTPIANVPSSNIARANYAKINIPTSYAYDGMWLRSPGDLPNTAAFLGNSFSQSFPGRVFQNNLSERGFVYPAVWVDEDIFSP
ncbi:MAG: hypothetical protein FWC28_00445 [Proteobacteria bacterium]|nr:hypothetical protein [Cystobacterineae bacterium]MCL2259692.1 hypothetical protein [Cystobacterineae bacterium]MCL2313711.1 hypothetical protein [Pseudomonadota bacterium]